ncbi:MAG: ABC transporter ATP-binding protein/permease [Prevotella sp.]|nr:ABC transporter ATP-binding protein/permease [Staphylococcus sp.]MCM1349778.1 ABC transporter ATP-binding protein/permease [Prevotella sp.]
MANPNTSRGMNGKPGGGPGGRFMQTSEKPQNTKKVLSRLIQYISSFKSLFIILLVVIVVLTLSTLSSNIIVKKIIETLGKYSLETNKWILAPNFNQFILFVAILAALYIIHCLCQYFSTLIGAYLAIKTTRKLRNDLFSTMVRLPIGYTDTHAHGDLMSRMTNDVDNISNTVSSTIGSLISGVLTILGCLCIMIYYSPLLTLVSLSSLVLTLIVTGAMSKMMKPLFKKQQELLGNLNTQTEEMVSGIKTVTAYNHQSIAMHDFNQYSDTYCKVGLKAQIISGSMGPVMNFIGNFGYFLVCFCGALFAVKGIGKTLLGLPLDVSIIVLFLTTSKQFTRPINEIAQLYSQILTALSGAERVFEVLDEATEDFSGEVSLNMNRIKGDIDFEHVAFGYVKEKPVLKDFTVDVYSGHKIALVGATGSGKTTIVNLLMRFYDLDSGTIRIDGIDIAKISKKELRDNIAIVLQDAVLFEDTIENNVKYGRENATTEEVMRAIEMANCAKFIKRLPEQEKTMLSEGGTNLSQGQRQLLTIARAILADPKILILDEATSSVDTRTEKKIQDAMVKLMENRTSIIIAHRLSTIQDADLIVVLDQGVVVEMGNHEELIQHQGVYNRLYQTQFSGLNT